MKQNWKYKLIATVFTAVVLFPFFAQATHALNCHEQIHCNTKIDKYYQQDQEDCSICNFQINNQTFDFSINYSIKNFEIIPYKASKFLLNEYIYYINHRSSRAPPNLV